MRYDTNSRDEFAVASGDDPMNLLSRVAMIGRKGAVYSGLILLLDGAALGTGSLILLRNMFHFFTLMTLMESALLFLIGGAIDVGGSVSFHKLTNHVSKPERGWSTEGHRNAQSRAAPIVLAGVILLVLSFALAYPLN